MSKKKIQILDVLGERVSLVPTDQEQTLVNFTEKYVPEGTSDKDIESMKAVFRKIFLNPKFNADTGLPLPSCDDLEKNIFTKAFQRRLELLQIEIANEKERKEDTVRLRQLSGHADRIQRFLEQTGCHQYKKASTEPIGELNDDDIKELLKQFVFLLLQAQHPLEDYEGRVPDPREFIETMQDNLLDNFDGFLKTYREEKHPIAPRIATLLEVADLDINAIKAEIDAGIAAKINIIIGDIRKIYPEPSFWEGLSSIDMRAVFDKLLQRLQEKDRQLQEKEAAILELQAQKAACEAKLKENEETISALKMKIQNLEAELAAAKQAASSKGTESESLKTALQQAQDDIAKYKQKIVALEAENKAINEKYVGLEQRLKALEEEIKRLSQIIEGLEAKNKELSALEDINNQLSAELETLRGLAEEKKTFQEQLTALQSRLDACNEEKKRLEAEKTQALGEKDAELARLQAQLDALRQGCEDEQRKMAARHQAELDAAKGEITNQLTQRHAAEIAELTRNHEGQIATLQSRIQELDAQNTTLQARIAALEREKAELQTRIDEQSAELNARVEALTLDVTRLREENARFTEQINTKTAEIETLRAADTAKETRIQTLQTQVASLTEERDRLQREATDLTQEVDRCTDALGKKEADLAALRGNLETKDGEISTLRTTIEAKTAEVAALTEERDEKLAQLQEKDARIQQLESDITRLQGIIQERNSTIRGQDTRLTQLQQTIANLEAQIKTLGNEKTDEVGSLRKERDQLLAEAATLTSQVGELDGRVKTISSQLESLQQQKKDCDTKLAEKQKLLEQALAREASKNTNSANAVAELRRLLEEQQQKNKELEELKAKSTQEILALQRVVEERNALLAEKAQFLKRIQELEQKIAEMSQRIETILGENNVKAEEYKSEISKLTAELQSKEAEKATLQKSLEDKIAALHEEYRRALGNQKSGYEEKLRGKEDTITSQRADILKLQGILAKAEETVALIKADALKVSKLLEETKTISAQTEEALRQRIQELTAQLQGKAGVEGEVKRLQDELKACQEAKAALEKRATASELEAAKISELTARLAAMEEKISGLEREKEAAVQEKEAAVQEKEAAVQEKEAAVQEKEAAVQEKEAAVQEKEAAVQEKEAAVQEKEAAVQEKEAAVQEKEAAVQEKEAAVQEKEAAVQEKEAAEEKYKAALESLQADLEKCHSELQTLREENEGLRNEIAGHLQRIQQIEAEKAELQGKLQEAEATILSLQSAQEKVQKEAQDALSVATTLEAKIKKQDEDINKIIAYIENPEEDLVLNLPENDPLEKLLQSMKGALSRRASVSSEDEKRLEWSTQRSFCYLMFMTAELWATYFPKVSEAAEQQKLKDVLDGSLYFPYKLDEMRSQVPDDPKFQGIYEKLKLSLKPGIKGNIDTIVNRKLIDIIIKIVSSMTSVMFSQSENVYILGVSIVSEDEKAILAIVESVLTEHAVHRYGSIQGFHDALEAYINIFSPPSHREQSLVYLTLSPSPVVLQSKAKPGSESKVLFREDADISRIEARDKALPMTKMNMDDESFTYLKTNKVLNYSSVLFLFLFAMRDYLHYFRGYDKGCPLPSFLKRNEVKAPDARSRVQPVSAAVPTAAAAAPPAPGLGPRVSASSSKGPGAGYLTPQPAFVVRKEQGKLGLGMEPAGK